MRDQLILPRNPGIIEVVLTGEVIATLSRGSEGWRWGATANSAVVTSLSDRPQRSPSPEMVKEAALGQSGCLANVFDAGGAVALLTEDFHRGIEDSGLRLMSQSDGLNSVFHRTWTTSQLAGMVSDDICLSS